MLALHTPTLRRVLVLAAVATGSTACGSDARDTSADGRTVVVTYSILGDVVRQIVGDAARVEVIVPDGQDPHEYEPSARDVERVHAAALVVHNGLDLEEGLADVLDQAAADGIAMFAAADHLTVRALDEHQGDGGDDHDEGAEDEGGHDEGADDEGGHDEGDHDGADPHFWTDPTKMAELAPDLADALERALGVELDERLDAFVASMAALDEEVRTIIGVLPSGSCRLVTGHESLGYFAQRYGCTVVGAVIPSLSSSAETSAAALAKLHEQAAAADVRAIFTEAGTPTDLAEQVASEVGAEVVELPSHDLPDSGGYGAYLTDLATRIVDGLSG